MRDTAELFQVIQGCGATSVVIIPIWACICQILSPNRLLLSSHFHSCVHIAQAALGQSCFGVI